MYASGYWGLFRLNGLEHHHALLASLVAVDLDGNHAICVDRVVAEIALRLKSTGV